MSVHDVVHLALPDLHTGLDTIRQAPKDQGVLNLIVARPAVNERVVLALGRLDVIDGLVGDTWRQRGSGRTPDGSAHPEMQINVMSSRMAALVAGDESRWPLAGDQLFVDLDLSVQNLPPGTQLAIGSAIIEVTDIPHTGCQKFVLRFGLDAMKFVNSPVGRELRLRGLNARGDSIGVGLRRRRSQEGSGRHSAVMSESYSRVQAKQEAGLHKGGPMRKRERLDPAPVENTIALPTVQQIAERAYARFEQRGGTSGGDLDDWLDAERELLGEAASQNGEAFSAWANQGQTVHRAIRELVDAE